MWFKVISNRHLSLPVSFRVALVQYCVLAEERDPGEFVIVERLDGDDADADFLFLIANVGELLRFSFFMNSGLIQ